MVITVSSSSFLLFFLSHMNIYSFETHIEKQNSRRKIPYPKTGKAPHNTGPKVICSPLWRVSRCIKLNLATHFQGEFAQFAYLMSFYLGTATLLMSEIVTLGWRTKRKLLLARLSLLSSGVCNFIRLSRIPFSFWAFFLPGLLDDDDASCNKDGNNFSLASRRTFLIHQSLSY